MKPSWNRWAIHLLLLACCVVSPTGWTAEMPEPSTAPAHVFHYEVSDKPQGPVPLQFPMDLTPGESQTTVTKSLQAKGINQGGFDKDFTSWSIPGKYSYKSFEPTAMTLAYKNAKLMQVTLVQPDMADCQDIIPMIEDAVAFIKLHYTFPAENIQTAPRYGSNNCVAYMKPGQSGWQAWSGDYSVNIDANWRDMKYTGFVTLTYLPLYNGTAETTKP